MAHETASLRSRPDVRWTAAEGWNLSRPRYAGDLTGDGIVDAVVQANRDARAETLVIAGPLLQPRMLPGDELVRFAHLVVRATGDLHGDGVADLVMSDRAGDHVLRGPLTRDSVSPGPIPPVGAYADFNGDHVLDIAFLTEPEQNLAIVEGPHALDRDGEVHVLVDVSACTEFGRPPLRPSGVRTLPDVTGDGHRELVLTPDDYATCHGPPRAVPYLGGGQVVTLTPHDPVVGSWLLLTDAVGDQTGDGIADAVRLERGLQWSEAPLSLGLRTPPPARTARLPEGGVVPQTFDLDGNGAVEILAHGGWGGSSWVSLVPGGLGDVGVPVLLRARGHTVEEQPLIVEDDLAWLPAVTRGGDVVLYGLGLGR